MTIEDRNIIPTLTLTSFVIFSSSVSKKKHLGDEEDNVSEKQQEKQTPEETHGRYFLRGN